MATSTSTGAASTRCTTSRLSPQRRPDNESIDGWTELAEPILDVDQTRYVWYAEVGDESTTIWANFQGADPTLELVEINVRRSVFYPMEHHLDYITVRGFEMAHAATPWAPPTADQPGLIGPNWAKGWIIEDNLIHDAKCSAISLGKEVSTGHNYATLRGDKPGYQYQLESVFSALQIGWDREHIGSHVVRRNTIFDCGQNAIVGHLGAVFSTIEDNHIHHIATKREFYGYEIAGIKLHAAIDVQILHNRIHDCTLGTWLDWQTQGTRVARNLFYANTRDLFVEVSHGPYLVDHNVLASRVALEVFSQGGAFVNNLVAGALRLEPVIDRATPYHRPHSTQVSGYAVICGGDDRYIGNLFLGGDADLAFRPGSDATRAGDLRHSRLRRLPRHVRRLPRRGEPDIWGPQALPRRQATRLHPPQRVRKRCDAVRGGERCGRRAGAGLGSRSSTRVRTCTWRSSCPSPSPLR